MTIESTGTDDSVATTDLFSKVRAVAGEMSPLGSREATSDDRLVEDLGYDSLAVIELSLRLEQDFGLQPSGDGGEVPDIKTVGDLEHFIAQRTGPSA